MNKRDCDVKEIRCSILDTFIIEKFCEVFFTDESILKITNGLNQNLKIRTDNNDQYNRVKDTLSRAETSRDNLIEAIIQTGTNEAITAKIKDMVFNEATSTKFINEKTVLNYESLFTEDEKRLIRNKSLRHIISSTRYNPQKYIPIVFKILTAKSPASKYIIDDFSDFNSQDKTLVWSIYKNMYDADENGMDGAFKSLYAIQKANADSKNYYAAVSSVADCIFSVDFI